MSFLADIGNATVNHTLLDNNNKKRLPVQKARFIRQNVMYGIFFALWLISFWYYVTVREHSPHVKMLSVDAFATKCEIFGYLFMSFRNT